MSFRNRVRNGITGYLFGKYDLEDEAQQYLVDDERYIEGIEIIYYDELLYLISFLVLISSILMSVFISAWFLLMVLPASYLIFIGSELELVYLTDERVIIEKRSWFEKLLNTTNVRSISLDQVAVVSYARAPFNYIALLTGIAFLFLSFLLFITSGVLEISIFLRFLLGIVFSLFGAYLTWFGLRLNKRSIELYVIGVRHPIGIGRKKGAVLWFARILKKLVFERVHHIFHDSPSDKALKEITEFPLDYSGVVKELIDEVHNPLQKAILGILDQSDQSKREIVEQVREHTKDEIDVAMKVLRKDKLIFYDRGRNLWCLNRRYIYEKKRKV